MILVVEIDVVVCCSLCGVACWFLFVAYCLSRCVLTVVRCLFSSVGWWWVVVAWLTLFVCCFVAS